MPARKFRLEFFTLSFEDGFVHLECQGRIRPDAIRDVEPRHPTAIV